LIGKPDVISTMAEVVEDLVKGELMQLAHIGIFILNYVLSSLMP
jgi:geranylgeranyl pyrophosphate synthase